MTPDGIASLILRVGVEPAVIVALLVYIFKVQTEFSKTVNDLVCSLNDNNKSLERLAEWVKLEYLKGDRRA